VTLIENRDFLYPLAFDVPPLWGPRRNIAIRFGTDKLEWPALQDGVKSLRIWLIVLIQYTNVTDRQTHAHRTTA